MVGSYTAYSLGYEGATLDQYVDVLKSSAISLVVDVRETPWSYKQGFSRRPLETRLHAEGISYLHLKSAGNPSKNRKQGLPQDAVIALYRRHLAANPSCLEEILDCIKKGSKAESICLLCFEREPGDCHRKVILDSLLTQERALVVTHLKIDSKKSAVKKAFDCEADTKAR